jgi:hypothetical protein
MLICFACRAITLFKSSVEGTQKFSFNVVRIYVMRHFNDFVKRLGSLDSNIVVICNSNYTSTWWKVYIEQVADMIIHAKILNTIIGKMRDLGSL